MNVTDKPPTQAAAGFRSLFRSAVEHIRRMFWGWPFAEDAVGDALLRWTVKNRELPTKSNLLFLAERAAIDRRRREHAQRRGGRARHLGLEGEALNVAAIDLSEETRRRVRRAFDGLQVELQPAVGLVLIWGFTVEDAAFRLGVSRSTVRRRVFAGKLALRRELGESNG